MPRKKKEDIKEVKVVDEVSIEEVVEPIEEVVEPIEEVVEPIEDKIIKSIDRSFVTYEDGTKVKLSKAEHKKLVSEGKNII